MKRFRRKLRLGITRLKDTIRILYTRARHPGSNNADSVKLGDVMKVTLNLTVGIETKALLKLLSSLWNIPMNDVMNRIVDDTCERELGKWPPKTLSRRLNKSYRKEFEADVTNGL